MRKGREEVIMRILNYRVFLRKEPEGGYTVIVPSLPGCVTYGETVDEAREMAREAIGLYIETLQANGEGIPVEDDILEAMVTVEADA
jgi:antitoxin HicB